MGSERLAGRRLTSRRLGTLVYLPRELDQRTKAIYCRTLAESANLHRGNYETITAADVEFLFALYDEYFTDGLLRNVCNGALSFRVSSRMTKSAGMLTYQSADGPYAISISQVLMFRAFVVANQPVVVNGVPCGDRLEVTMRVLEHEIVHLLELLAYGSTSCARPRFRGLSRRLFGHADVTHQLGGDVAPMIRTRFVQAGDTVSFEYRGRTHTGTVARVTKRATVMVRNPSGEYVDTVGVHYSKYYVPLHCIS